jgi:hypothetical protein
MTNSYVKVDALPSVTSTVEFYDGTIQEVDHGTNGAEGQGVRGQGWDAFSHGQHDFEIFTSPTGSSCTPEKRLGRRSRQPSGPLHPSKFLFSTTTNHAPITQLPMAVFTIKAASRAILRRTHFPSRQQPSIKKGHHSSTNPAVRPKAGDDPANGTAIPIPATVANVPLWQRLGPLSRGFQAYGRSQRKRPYATQFCSSLVIYFLGDLSAQNINGDEYDPKRMLRALVISAGSSIPTYRWYVVSEFKKR